MTNQPTAESARADTVSALERGVKLLNCFNEQTLSLSAAELASATGIPRPSVIRLAATLCVLGLMRVTVAGDRYALGPGLVSLSQAFLASMDQRGLFREWMQPLADQTQGSLYLALRDGLEMVVIEACRAAGSMLSARVEVGTRTPLASSALGRAYLSGVDPAVCSRLVDELRSRHAQAWPVLGEQLQQALVAAAQTGYCISLGTFHPDINSVSLALRGPTGEVFSVNCGGAAFRFSESRLVDDIVPRLRELTRTLAQAMGGQLIELNKAAAL